MSVTSIFSHVMACNRMYCLENGQGAEKRWEEKERKREEREGGDRTEEDGIWTEPPAKSQETGTRVPERSAGKVLRWRQPCAMAAGRGG